MTRPQIHSIKSDCLYPIVATVRHTLQAKGVILINAGTCIRRAFYDNFAAYLSSQGYSTVQYDYIGVGDSKPSSLKDVNRSIYDWGTKDLQIMNDWIDGEFPDVRKFIVGHSMGGQLVGLMPSINSFEKVITIASSYGNCRNFDTARKWKMLIALNSMFPLLNWWYGYFPAKKLGMGSDWPHGVAEDWRNWNTKYLSLRQWMDRLGKTHQFDQFDVPMTAYLLHDDIMATSRCIPHFKIDYPNADIRMVNPSDYQLKELGHFKTFHPQAEAFWEAIVQELELG